VSSLHTTLRSGQVTYDLAQLDPVQLFTLRDTIIAALEHFKEGPRAIILQLCLALSGLALQLPTWTNAVEGLIDSYGQNPSMVPVLLQFLTVLPEELYSNTKIPVTVGSDVILPNPSLLKLILPPSPGPGIWGKERAAVELVFKAGSRGAFFVFAGPW
jgi:hypothetical protein